MRYLALFGLLGALVADSQALASEDMDSLMFDAGLDVVAEEELAEDTKLENTGKEDKLPLPVKVPKAQSDSSSSEATPSANQQEASKVPAVTAAPPPPPSGAVKSKTAAVGDIKKGQKLTDTLKNDSDDPKNPSSKVEGTWVDKLASGNPLDILNKDEKDKELKELVDSSRIAGIKGQRSNASVFDISGVMLRMSLSQVDQIMKNRGFQKLSEKYQVPNFIKWRNEEHCRLSGVVGYERTQACVMQKAKKDKHQYVQSTNYAKFDTQEEVTVTFTSNFTANKVYKIEYISQSTNNRGNSQKAVYLRNVKIFDFWKKINQKYGKPNDKEKVIWGMGGNKPYLKAKTGWLLLEDPMLRELDYTRMSREDQRYLNTDLYSF